MKKPIPQKSNQDSADDYIAWADDSYSEGMKTTTEYQTETDGDANAS